MREYTLLLTRCAVALRHLVSALPDTRWRWLIGQSVPRYTPKPLLFYSQKTYKNLLRTSVCSCEESRVLFISALS